MKSASVKAPRRPGCRPWLTLPAIAAILLAVTFWTLPGQTLLWREVQNTGHTLLFGVLAVLALCSYRAVYPAYTHSPLRSYLVAGSACLLAGCAVELVQLLAGGDADPGDVLRDLAGILIALCICAAFGPWPVRTGQAVRHGTPRTLLLALAAGLTVASSWPLASLVRAYHQRAQAFPVIVDLAANWSRPFVQLNHARLEQTGDASVCAAPSSAGLVRLQLEPVRFPGISVIEPQPDWSGYDYLVLELYSTQPDPFGLTLRIHDARHDQAYTDRFNRRLTLAPGENRIRIPLARVRDAPAGRRMDMTDIAGIMLFAASPGRPLAFCTGVRRLE
jgi:hypothetical protein